MYFWAHLDFTLIALIEWMVPETMVLRPIFIIIALICSIWYLFYRVTMYGWSKNISHYLLLFRGVICPLVFVLAILLQFDLKYPLGIYLFSCIFDLIRHNMLLRTVLKRYYKNIIEYLIILGALCFFFSVVLFKRKSLKNFNTKAETLLDLFLLNIQIIGFDSWG